MAYKHIIIGLYSLRELNLGCLHDDTQSQPVDTQSQPDGHVFHSPIILEPEDISNFHS